MFFYIYNNNNCKKNKKKQHVFQMVAWYPIISATIYNDMWIYFTTRFHVDVLVVEIIICLTEITAILCACSLFLLLWMFTELSTWQNTAAWPINVIEIHWLYFGTSSFPNINQRSFCSRSLVAANQMHLRNLFS